MNFDLNDEQQEIKRTAHEFLASRFAPSKARELAEARSYDDGLWNLGQLGGRVSPSRRTMVAGTGNGRARGAARGVRRPAVMLLGTAGAALVMSAAGSDENAGESPRLASG